MEKYTSSKKKSVKKGPNGLYVFKNKVQISKVNFDQNIQITISNPHHCFKKVRKKKSKSGELKS